MKKYYKVGDRFTVDLGMVSSKRAIIIRLYTVGVSDNGVALVQLMDEESANRWNDIRAEVKDTNKIPWKVVQSLCGDDFTINPYKG